MLGPVFRAELLRTARRRRYYVLRFLYGLVILLAMWLSYEHFINILDRAIQLSYQQLAGFADWCFRSLLIGQGITLLVLIPAIVGGVIADEKQRKTLHYLMTSQLSSAEIVCDKLAARLLHLGVFVAIGVPVVCLIGLFGGLSPEMVVGGYSVTAALVFFASALALLVSTYARTVRQAVVVAYVAQLAWLALPIFVTLLGALFVSWWFQQRPFPVSLMEPTLWLAATHPVSLLVLMQEASARRVFPGPGPLEAICLMMACQLMGGLLFLSLAIQRLRPVYLKQETAPRRLDWFPRRAKLRKRPVCGEHAVLWRECWIARTDVFTKMFVLPATIVLTVFMVFASGMDEWMVQSIQSLFISGPFGFRMGQLRLNDSLRFISPPYIALWLLAVAGFSASSVTGERERDTWVSLVSSPLSGREIMLGKLAGGLWNLRGFGVLLGLFWVFSLLAGGLHPLGFLYGVVLLAILTASVAAIGLRMSLTSKSTSQALAKTLALLLLLNAGYMLPVYPWIAGWWQWLGCTPYLVSQALWSYDDVRRLAEGFPDWNADWETSVRRLWISVTWTPAVIGAYAAGGLLFLASAIHRFDRLVGRPHKAGHDPAPVRLGSRELRDVLTASASSHSRTAQRRDHNLITDLSARKR